MPCVDVEMLEGVWGSNPRLNQELIPANSRGPSIVSKKIFDKTATLTECKLQKQPSRNANGM